MPQLALPERAERTSAPAPTLSLQAFDGLIKSLYLGPTENPPWQSFLELLREQIRATHCCMLLRLAEPNKPMLMVVAGPTRTECLDSYNDRFFQFDPFSHLRPHRVMTHTDVMSDEEWLQSAFYRNYLQQEDVRHVLGVQLKPDANCNGYTLRITRSHDLPAFGDAEKQIIEMLVPHLQQAVALRSHAQNLEMERQLLAGTVERMQVGTVMLDDKGDVMSLNAMAQATLNERDGIALAGKTLALSYPEEQQQLRSLVATVLAAAGGEKPSSVQAMAITRPSGRSKLSVLVRLVPAGEYSEGWNRARVAVFLRDPEAQSQGSTEILARLYGLTKSEARLALLVANGQTLESTADQLHVSRNTIRAHLRSIFSKMGVTRQMDLVRLVSNSVVELA